MPSRKPSRWCVCACTCTSVCGYVFIVSLPHQVGAGKVRPALTLVGYEDELKPAMAFVFGSTFVCDTLQTAKKVTFDRQVMTRSVALAGDVFDPSGTLTGGTTANSSPQDFYFHTSSLLTSSSLLPPLSSLLLPPPPSSSLLPLFFLLPSRLSSSAGARPQTTSILTKLQEVCTCEGTLHQKTGELREFSSQLEQIQRVASK